MNKFTKIITIVLIATLLISFTSSEFAEANDYPSEKQIKDDPYTSDISKEELKLHKDIIFDDSDEAIAVPRMAPLIPFVASAVFKILAKQGAKTFVKSISKHALQRAGQRGITKHMMANTLKNGTKYTDKKTGAKILHDRKTGTTLVIKGKNVVTTYKQNPPKKAWRRGH
ncbi:TPA: hypothetical protein PP833_001385 [Staphylococcus aureus]|nr:hypothetical protein [Staphylococcus aureus]